MVEALMGLLPPEQQAAHSFSSSSKLCDLRPHSKTQKAVSGLVACHRKSFSQNHSSKSMQGKTSLHQSPHSGMQTKQRCLRRPSFLLLGAPHASRPSTFDSRTQRTKPSGANQSMNLSLGQKASYSALFFCEFVSLIDLF